MMTYKYTCIRKQEVQNHIKKVLDAERIKPLNSLWSTPICIVQRLMHPANTSDM